MDILGGQYKSPFGYYNNDNQIDSYGVNHSGFSTADELRYQTARADREKQLKEQLQSLGITEYPQYKTDFWGTNADNNYGFGSSNIRQAVDNMQQTTYTPVPDFEPIAMSQNNQQSTIEAEQTRRGIENSLLLDGMDILYGANRAINGITLGGLDKLGNKFDIDTQMSEYVQLRDNQGQGNIVRNTGKIAEYGGAALPVTTVGQAIYEPANMAYNGYKIKKAYDRLNQDPFSGKGSDIIAKMKNHEGQPVVLQRGEAMLDENGTIVTSGRPLQHVTGTARNYGLNKIIYKHNMPREEVAQLPKLLKNNQPAKISPRNQHIYVLQRPNGETFIATTPKQNIRTISSMYVKTK